jgi:hypothetical protein
LLFLIAQVETFYTEPDDQRSDLGSYIQGYITNGSTICFGTDAHLNSHWIEVYLSQQVPDFGVAERVIVLPLQVDSGKVGITSLLELDEPLREVAVTPGQYSVYLLAFNLGIDQATKWQQRDFTDDSDPPAGENDRGNVNFEWYQIILSPGQPDNIGVVKWIPKTGQGVKL